MIFTVHEVLGKKWYWIEEDWIKAELFRSYEKFVCTRHYSMYHFCSKSTQKDFFQYCGHPKHYKMFYPSVNNVNYNKSESKEGVCVIYLIEITMKRYFYIMADQGKVKRFLYMQKKFVF